MLIFDCCYAGNLLPCDVHAHYPTRSFECIAACGSDKETTRPGENSFTASLIWSLKVLEKDRKSFTTQKLQTMIMKAPNFPPNQFVPLLQHDEPCDQQLVLAPLSTGFSAIFPKFAISTRTGNELPQNYLDLRFWYLNRPDEEEIENLASRFRKLIKDETISASRIGWVNLKTRDREARSSPRWRTVNLRNPPVELSMNGKVASPGGVLCASMPSNSNTSQPTISRRHLKSQDVSKANHGVTESMGISRQEHEPMGIANRDLRAIASISITREANISQYDHEPMFAVNFEAMIYHTRGALLRRIQDTYSTLGVVTVVALALSICAWYALSLRSFPLSQM